MHPWHWSCIKSHCCVDALKTRLDEALSRPWIQSREDCADNGKIEVKTRANCNANFRAATRETHEKSWEISLLNKHRASKVPLHQCFFVGCGGLCGPGAGSSRSSCSHRSCDLCGTIPLFTSTNMVFKNHGEELFWYERYKSKRSLVMQKNGHFNLDFLSIILKRSCFNALWNIQSMLISTFLAFSDRKKTLAVYVNLLLYVAYCHEQAHSLVVDRGGNKIAFPSIPMILTRILERWRCTANPCASGQPHVKASSSS